MDKLIKNTMYLIGNSHIDPVWLWQWQEGYAEVKATFRSVLDRMNEYDDFVFVCGGVGQFKWLEENCPELLDEIKVRVKQGRWQIVGGWWVQPDCNLPCGESFVRHSLYSQRFLKDTFGIMATTGYNVDSFGHSNMLPQILKKSGMDNYVFMRPGSTETTIPDPLFWWEGPDGARVLAFRILDNHYNNSFRKLEETVQKSLVREDMNTDKLMFFYGVGNHGGGPTIKALEIIGKMQKEFGKDKLFMSTPDNYFADRRSESLDYPVYTTDIQHHASGSYATDFSYKKEHRYIEQLLLVAERWNTVSQHTIGYINECPKLKPAWLAILFIQDHDIMCGCSIEVVMKNALEDINHAKYIASHVLNASLQKISWSINTAIPGAIRSKEQSGQIWAYADHPVPMIVFNPLPFPVKQPIRLDLKLKSIKDVDGNDIETQTIMGRFLISNHNKGSIFMAEVPALGYTTYWLTPLERPKEKPPFVPDVELEPRYVLENEWTRLTVDKTTGLVSSLFDKINNIEHVKPNSAKPLIIDEEEHDTWGHGTETFDKVIGEFKTESVQLTEDGPVRSTIRVSSTYGKSQLRQDFSLYKDSADVEARLRVNWQEKHKILKLAFEINVDNPIATYSTPYGHIAKECDGREEPGMMWMDVSDKNSTQGVAIACQARYSYSAKANFMRLNIVRSPIFADHDAALLARNENFEHMDQGVHKMTYHLVAHKGDWRTSGIVQKALSLNNPLHKVHETYHEGPLPQHVENVTISNPQVVLTVLKPCEDGNGTVIRLYETYGQKSETNIKIPMLNVDSQLHFGAFEIKSLLIDEMGNLSSINLLEFPD
ncbi:MAG: alpha-mannosidase [Clostridiales bacterium]|nr:alpha-mannosidase [Clostridiales bacterium]